MKAEQYLKRIENKGISDTLNYSRKEMIDFAEKYAEQLIIGGVLKWVALKSNIKPEDDTEVLVRLKSGKVRTALFSSEDYRFYNSLNDQDITELITDYASMPK